MGRGCIAPVSGLRDSSARAPRSGALRTDRQGGDPGHAGRALRRRRRHERLLAGAPSMHCAASRSTARARATRARCRRRCSWPSRAAATTARSPPGLLNGWTAAGTRPEFKLVTGISTGALIAPFAFLGPKYDATLKEVYTTITPKDVIEPRGLIAGVLSDAMADNAPLWALTRKSVTEELAEGSRRGIREGPRPAGRAPPTSTRAAAIIWDMGKIATYGRPAGAGPVRQRHDRVGLHSGGLPAGDDRRRGRRQALPGNARGRRHRWRRCSPIRVAGYRRSTWRKRPESSRERRLYVIRNARLDPDWAQVERRR